MGILWQKNFSFFVDSARILFIFHLRITNVTMEYVIYGPLLVRKEYVLPV